MANDIDNSEAIRKLMHFECVGDVYFVEIQKRGKDTGTRDDKVVKDYHIHGLYHLDKVLPEIRELCHRYNARAMIRLNQRNTYDANIMAQIEMLAGQLTANKVYRKMVRTGKTNITMPSVRSAANLYASALGKCVTEDSASRKWIIDIDPDMVNSVTTTGVTLGGSLSEIADTFSQYIMEFCANKGSESRELCRLRSRSGLHMVTTTFRKDMFVNKFGKPANQHEFVMTDANTNLYIPGDANEAV